MGAGTVPFESPQRGRGHGHGLHDPAPGERIGNQAADVARPHLHQHRTGLQFRKDHLLAVHVLPVGCQAGAILVGDRISLEIEREALKLATQDAQLQGRLITETLGLKLGLARTVNASSQNVNPPPMPKMTMRAAMADAAPSGNEQMGFAAGQIRAQASVTVEFEMLP